MSFRILFLIDGLGPGGAERSLAEVLPGLARGGITTTVAFFHRHQNSLEDELRTHGVDLRFIPEQGVAQRVAAIRRLIREGNPDVIHTTLYVSDVLGRIASIGLHKVVVSSLVSTPYDPVRRKNPDINAVKLKVARWIDTWTARYFTTHFHAVSETVKQAAVDAMGLRPERISVVQRGRNTRFMPPTPERRAKARHTLGLRDSDDVIVNVGRQGYEKGQQYLLEAMEAIVQRRPNSILLVAGPRGGQAEILDELRRRPALKECVRLLGHRTDVPDLLASADLFAFPSLYQGAAGALIEAMASGLPVVASRIPSIAEIVEEGRNALLVERMSVAPLADAIVELLADRSRAGAFGNRSRAIFEERFTLERCTERMTRFYRDMVEHRDRFVPAKSTSAVGCP